MVPIADGTICPGSSDPFYLVSSNITWVTTSWTYCKTEHVAHMKENRSFRDKKICNRSRCDKLP